MGTIFIEAHALINISVVVVGCSFFLTIQFDRVNDDYCGDTVGCLVSDQ